MPSPHQMVFDRTFGVTIVSRVVSSLLALALHCAAADSKAAGYQQSNARGLLVPIYHGDPPQLGAMFRVDRLFTDYAKKGFFHIGLFPILVAEGVHIEIRNPDLMSESLAAMSAWKASGTKKHVGEMRRVKMTFPPSIGKTLEAGSIHLADHGQWTLSHGVIIVDGNTRYEASSALLQIVGPNAGVVSWQTGGDARSIHLLTTPSAPPLSKTNTTATITSP